MVKVDFKHSVPSTVIFAPESLLSLFSDLTLKEISDIRDKYQHDPETFLNDVTEWVANQRPCVSDYFAPHVPEDPFADKCVFDYVSKQGNTTVRELANIIADLYNKKIILEDTLTERESIMCLILDKPFLADIIIKAAIPYINQHVATSGLDIDHPKVLNNTIGNIVFHCPDTE